MCRLLSFFGFALPSMTASSFRPASNRRCHAMSFRELLVYAVLIWCCTCVVSARKLKKTSPWSWLAGLMVVTLACSTVCSLPSYAPTIVQSFDAPHWVTVHDHLLVPQTEKSLGLPSPGDQRFVLGLSFTTSASLQRCRLCRCSAII